MVLRADGIVIAITATPLLDDTSNLRFRRLLVSKPANITWADSKRHANHSSRRGRRICSRRSQTSTLWPSMPNSHARLARVAAASRATGRKSSPRADDAHRCQRLRMACRHTPAVRPLRGIRDLEVRSIAHPDLGEAQGPAARTLCRWRGRWPAAPIPCGFCASGGWRRNWPRHASCGRSRSSPSRFHVGIASIAIWNGWAQRSPCSASRRHAAASRSHRVESASCALVANATGHPGARGLRGSRSHTASSRSKKSR